MCCDNYIVNILLEPIVNVLRELHCSCFVSLKCFPKSNVMFFVKGIVGTTGDPGSKGIPGKMVSLLGFTVPKEIYVFVNLPYAKWPSNFVFFLWMTGHERFPRRSWWRWRSWCTGTFFFHTNNSDSWFVSSLFHQFTLTAALFEFFHQ